MVSTDVERRREEHYRELRKEQRANKWKWFKTRVRYFFTGRKMTEDEYIRMFEETTRESMARSSDELFDHISEDIRRTGANLPRYPYSVLLKGKCELLQMGHGWTYRLTDEIQTWLDQNGITASLHATDNCSLFLSEFVLEFEKEDDAMLFKLTWIGQ